MTPDQERFLLLHTLHQVARWQWRMNETYLVAFTDRNQTATLHRLAVLALIDAGLMFKGAGVADVHPTAAGRAAMCPSVRI